MRWNERPPTPEEYAALTEAKRLAEQRKNHRVIVYAPIKGASRNAGVYRCDVFGYVSWIAETSQHSATGHGFVTAWIGFPDQHGGVDHVGSIFRRRVVHHHHLPDQHVYRPYGEVR